MQKRAIDYTLLITLIILVVYGLLMVFSASYYMAQSSKLYNYDGLALFKKQLIGAVAGGVAMVFFVFFDYKKLMKFKYLILGLAVVLMIAVWIPGVGKQINGSHRWIELGPIPSIQPAEIAKVALIIFTASTIYVNRNRMHSFRYGIVPNFIVLLLLCGLLYFQPNFSAIIVMCAVVFIMIFVGGAKWQHLLLIAVIGAALGIFLMLRATYRVGRVSSFSDPWKDPTGDSYQVVQSLYGIGSGGFFGSGLGNGRQKLLWLPYSESDFIFAIVAEELGFAGAAVLLLLFGILIYRGIKIAAKAPDLFATMLATGITTVIALQVIFNVAVVTASMPATGVSLPFISYGSTSLVIFMAMIGILLNISRQSRQLVASKKSSGKVAELHQNHAEKYSSSKKRGAKSKPPSKKTVRREY